MKVWVIYEESGYDAIRGTDDEVKPPCGAFASEQSAQNWVSDNIPHHLQFDYKIVEFEVAA